VAIVCTYQHLWACCKHTQDSCPISTGETRLLEAAFLHQEYARHVFKIYTPRRTFNESFMSFWSTDWRA